MGLEHHHRRRSRRNGVILLAVFGIAAIVLFAAAMHIEQAQHVQERGVATQGIGQLKRISYEGEEYVEKSAMTSILLMGIDRAGTAVSYGARQGGQSDFLLLVVIDHNTKTIHQLQIDRDTITEVETLGILGNPIGTKAMQICLAHSFGITPEENCGFAQRAVENLLEGIEVDYYIALDMDAIGTLNDALGGVTVTLEEDFSAVDPLMQKGATLQLSAQQAETLVRSRMEIGDGTNEARMQRQRLFMQAAIRQLRERLQQEPEYITELFDALEPDMTANIQRGQLLNEVNQAYRYEILSVEDLDGEHAIGSDGFVEFHVAPQATAQWVVKTFYTRGK